MKEDRKDITNWYISWELVKIRVICGSVPTYVIVLCTEMRYISRETHTVYKYLQHQNVW